MLRYAFFFIVFMAVLTSLSPVHSLASTDNKLDFLSNTHDEVLIEEEVEFLSKEDAFQYNYQQQADQLELSFDIAKGYYLYRKQFKFMAEKAGLGEAIIPDGEPYQDEYFGETEIYKGSVTIRLPLYFALSQSVVNIRYQGCAEAGLCYPPSVITLDLQPFNSQAANAEKSDEFSLMANEFSLSQALSTNSLAITLALFFVLGVGLSLTPCVFPMYPILSSIIVGQEKLSNRQALLLSFVFVQGMAIAYSILGLIAASAGASFQAALQSPTMLIALSVLFIILASAMFGLFELQLPSSWVNKLNQTSNNQQTGKLKGALIMGLLSGLIASPCTTAPLSGALLYVAQTGDLFIGFISLYILSLGMGLPLLIIGASSGKWLPKAGGWMESVKKLFAFILLAVPLMLLARFIDEYWIIVLSAALAFSCGLFFAYPIYKKQASKLTHIIMVTAVSIAVYFAYLAVNYQQLVLPFKVFTDVEILKTELAKAKQQQTPVLLDITAEWCVGCKEFEHLTFANPAVQHALDDYSWLQFDVTEYTPAQDQFIQSLNIVGPPAPTVLIYNAQGTELAEQRIRGFLPPEKFINAILKQ